jgi:hypothetical protein
MDNPETLATLSKQGTGRRQMKHSNAPQKPTSRNPNTFDDPKTFELPRKNNTRPSIRQQESDTVIKYYK